MSSHALADVAVAAGDSVDALVVWSEVWTGLTVTAGIVHTLGLAHAHVLAELKAAVSVVVVAVVVVVELSTAGHKSKSKRGG
jgi:hypothetical protein